MCGQKQGFGHRIRPFGGYPWHGMPAGGQTAFLDQELSTVPRGGQLVLVGATDARHPQAVGAQHAGVDDDRVDQVQPAQRLPTQRQHRVSIGQPAPQRGRERLGSGPAGLGRGHQDCGGDHVHVAGEGGDQPGAERLQQRELSGVAFGGPGRPPMNRDRLGGRLVGVARQVRFVLFPDARLGAAFGGFQRLHRQPHRQGGRRQRDGLRDRCGQRQHGVGGGPPDAALDHSAQGGLVFHQRNDRLHGARGMRPPQGPSGESYAQAGGGGGHGHGSGRQHQAVARQTCRRRRGSDGFF